MVTPLDALEQRGLVHDPHVGPAVGDHDGLVGGGREVDQPAQVGVVRGPRRLAQVFAGPRPVGVEPHHDGMGEDELQRGDAFDEVPHVVVDGVRDDLLGGAGLHDPAVLHDRDAAADADGLVEVVGDEDGGLVELRRQGHELLLELAPDERVEGGEGLVHEQDLGVGGQSAGEPHPLLHPAGELAREAVLVAVEVDEAVEVLVDGWEAPLRCTDTVFNPPFHVTSDNLLNSRHYSFRDRE